MKRISKRTAVLLAVATAAIVAAVGAYAYWTTGGTGTGSASTTTTQNVVVNQTNGAITTLYPGGPSFALSGDFDNPNSGPAYVASVTAVVSAVTTDTQAGKPACATSDFQITGTSNTPGDIPSGNGQGSWSGLSVSMLDTAANQDNCKNQTLTITYTANAA
jgi:hypothetical protein